MTDIAVTGLTPTPGDGQVTLKWTAPAAPVLGYSVGCSDAATGDLAGNPPQTSGTTSVISGLTNGVDYDFEVTPIVGVAASTVSATPEATPPPPATVNSLAAILSGSDFKDPDLEDPAVPADWSWATKGQLANPTPPAGCGYMTAWGQFYWPAGGPQPAGVWVNYRWQEGWALTASGWHKTQDLEGGFTAADGQHFTDPTFSDDSGHPPQFRKEADGTTSVLMVPGDNYHFWPGARGPLPAGVQGAYSTYQARITPDSPSALLACNAGIDWWTSPSGGTNPLCAIGRFLPLGGGGITYPWTAFSCCSVPGLLTATNCPTLR